MKIAIFSDCYLDLTGGIVSVINTDKAELERRGHEVYVFSSAYPRSAAEVKKLAKNHIFPVPSCRVFGRGLTPIARRPRIIEKFLLKNFPELKDFDVFYVHYEAGCSIAGLRLAKKMNIPSVQVMHGREDVGEEKLIPLGLRTFVAFCLNLFHSWYLPHPVKIRRDDYLATTIAKAKMWTLMVNHANAADLVLTPSRHFRQKLVHYGVTRQIFALPHGLPEQFFENSVRQRVFRPGEPLGIISASRVSGEKRLLPFLAALAQLPRGSYHFSVYGAGPDLKKAQKFAKKHHLNVTFYGNQPFETVWRALSRAHLAVLTSYNYDTFGMTLAEASVAGTPSFIVDPDLAETTPEGSYILAESPDPDEMATALKNLIAHPEKNAKMSEIALKNREKMQISQKITKLEDFFHNLTSKSLKKV